MFKREYLVSYNWESKKNGNGMGYTTFSASRKIKSDDIGMITNIITNNLIDNFKDNNDYFSIVILNIVRL